MVHFLKIRNDHCTVIILVVWGICSCHTRRWLDIKSTAHITFSLWSANWEAVICNKTGCPAKKWNM